MDQDRDRSIEKIKELTEGIDFCMLTTVDSGQLRSRPMSTQQTEFDGDLWFFTSDNTHKIEEIEKDNRVCVAYSKPDDSTYVSISGRAEVVKDPAKIEELWSPILKAWFPEGIDDPHLCLLKVNAEQAEYWESPSGTIVQLLGFVKAIATGQEADWGENKKIELEGKGSAA
jgi:general stress protein 26